MYILVFTHTYLYIFKYKGDPEIDEFMREFGKVMSGHFNRLSEDEEEQKKGGKDTQTKHQQVSELKYM